MANHKNGHKEEEGLIQEKEDKIGEHLKFNLFMTIIVDFPQF